MKLGQQPCPFVDILLIGALPLQHQNQTIAMKIRWPLKPKTFTIYEKSATQCIHSSFPYSILRPPSWHVHPTNLLRVHPYPTSYSSTPHPIHLLCPSMVSFSPLDNSELTQDGILPSSKSTRKLSGYMDHVAAEIKQDLGIAWVGELGKGSHS